ncbi:MAG: 16S rRNA (uracil(1498)-N(3))-methyltransferase [Treponemataceae bacterium]|nr:MAG: 16S rRNA (uracil(1498)-N(3))-methyltransferase [Treponemataceae bacterium]
MRQFIAVTEPDAHGKITLSLEDRRYLCSVLRMRHGDTIDVRLKNGSIVNATIEGELRTAALRIDLSAMSHPSLSSSQSSNRAGNPENTDFFSQTDFYLFQFLPKLNKMDLVVRQAVECGIKTVLPIIGAYSDCASYPESAADRMERWGNIVREARGQSGSAVATEVRVPVTVGEAIAFWQNLQSPADCAVLLSENAQHTAPLHSYVGRKIAAVGAVKNAALAVGCEGGIREDERRAFIAAGFMPVHFSTNILRAETAALYGMAALQNCIMEFDIWKCKEFTS